MFLYHRHPILTFDFPLLMFLVSLCDSAAGSDEQTGQVTLVSLAVCATLTCVAELR